MIETGTKYNYLWNTVECYWSYLWRRDSHKYIYTFYRDYYKKRLNKNTL